MGVIELAVLVGGGAGNGVVGGGRGDGGGWREWG